MIFPHESQPAGTRTWSRSSTLARWRNGNRVEDETAWIVGAAVEGEEGLAPEDEEVFVRMGGGENSRWSRYARRRENVDGCACEV